MVHTLLSQMGMAAKRYMSQGMSRDQAIEHVREDVIRWVASVPDMASKAPHAVALVQAILHFGPSFSIDWAENAFATIEPSHKLAASLMCTSIPREVAEGLPLPWRCFAISIPKGLIQNKYSPDYLLVRQGEDGKMEYLEVSPNVMAYGRQKTMGDFAKMDLGEPLHASVPSEQNKDFDAHPRIALLIGRLLVGVCIEMDSPSGVEAARSTPKEVRVKRDVPKAWTYKLGRPVNLDARDAVHCYVTGEKRGAATVQVLVCGHRKRQPHGPNNSLRKWIHVEPYWKGPEEAPIVVRSHRLGEP